MKPPRQMYARLERVTLNNGKWVSATAEEMRHELQAILQPFLGKVVVRT